MKCTVDKFEIFDKQYSAVFFQQLHHCFVSSAHPLHANQVIILQ